MQLLYLPMLFLSGATFPTSMMPIWLRTLAQYLPATHIYQGVQSILIGGQPLSANGVSIFALLLATAVSFFVGLKLFRWEKEEKISGKAKLWILAVLLPFFAMGAYQTRTQENLGRSKILTRQAMRSQTYALHQCADLRW